MNKPDLGYYTLNEAAERWHCTVYKIIEWGANGILKICKTKEIRQAHSTKIDKKCTSKSLPASDFERILENIFPNNSEDLMIGTSLSITKEEFHRFDSEHNAEKNYPLELRIAVEVWREVFGNGIKESSLNKFQSDAVEEAIKSRHSLKAVPVGRISQVVVADKKGSKLTETTTTPHNINRPDHQYYSECLASAVDFWGRIKDYPNYKDFAPIMLEGLYSPSGENLGSGLSGNQKELIRLMVAPGSKKMVGSEAKSKIS